VRGDRVQLARAVLNVVENAVRAGGPAGRTEVRVGTEQGFVSVEVDDDGPGFARIPTGTGLGLRIARKALTQCGGGLAVTTSRRGGACVRLAVPLVARVPVPRGALDQRASS
jgi:signal transduction histidine kinase